jgi:peptide methionine sulfoxide reductase MsrB
MTQKKMTEKHEFSPLWDEHEKGFYCIVCGVLKEEHRQFEPDTKLEEPA